MSQFMVDFTKHNMPEDIFARSDLDTYEGYGIFETRTEFEDYLSRYIRYHLRRMIRLVTGDFLGVYASGIKSDSAAITAMNDLLFTAVEHEEEEQFLIAFLYEVDTRLDSAIENYKSTIAKRLEHVNHHYHNGLPLLSVEEEEDQLSTQQLADSRWSTGPIDEHFQQFLLNCHTRAGHITHLTKTFEGLGFESLTPDYYQRFAEVLTDEREGIQVKATQDYGCNLYINSPYITLRQPMDWIPVAIDDVNSMRMVNTGQNDGMLLHNYSNSAIIATVGTSSSSVEVLISAAEVNPTLETRTPHAQTFNNAQIDASITFRVLPRPVFDPPQPITMALGDKHIVSGGDLFSGERILSYGLSNDNTGVVSVSLDQSTGEFTVNADNIGTATLTLSAINPSGATPLPLPLHCTIA